MANVVCPAKEWTSESKGRHEIKRKIYVNSCNEMIPFTIAYSWVSQSAITYFHSQ